MKKAYAHSLVDLLRGNCEVPAALDTHLSGIEIDSRKVKKGDLFIALANDEVQLDKHISQALDNGANAVLREGREKCCVHEDKDAVEVCLKDLHEFVGEIVSKFYLNPSSDLKVIGITGTNGKTSVANYLASYLSTRDKKCGVIGTLGYGLLEGGFESLVETGYTTPNIVDVHRILASMRDEGADIVVMEVSSHGLYQGRVDSVEFYGAVFTNLTRDHLDYHGSMDEYASAKQALFEVESLKFAVLNRDDDYFEQFKAAVDSEVELRSYALESHASDISVLTKEYSAAGISAQVKTPVGQVKLDSELLGEFNLSNLLAVVAVASVMNDLEELETRLNQIKPVPGRMEVIRYPNKSSVVVDYAHTPDALENVLQSLRALCETSGEGKLRVIFGCGGDRDQGKRAEMAKIAELLADDIIVTDDNPRGELPEAIIADIMFGFEDETKVEVIHDRRAAIGRMLGKSAKQDVVLVAGKGHETWQEVKGQRHYFSDVETVRELMASLKSNEHREYEVEHD